MAAQSLTLSACAKINLDLRVIGVRPDGYHDLRTVFQSLALHDTLTFTARTGRFRIECDDPTLPTDRRNLIWKAASLLWRTIGRRRGDIPRDAVVTLRKRVPAKAGLGSGSSDAAIALLGCAYVWRLDLDPPTLNRLAARIGSDVPFFLVGGTALGLGRALRGQTLSTEVSASPHPGRLAALSPRDARGEDREREQRDGGEAHPPRG